MNELLKQQVTEKMTRYYGTVSIQPIPKRELKNSKTITIDHKRVPSRFINYDSRSYICSCGVQNQWPIFEQAPYDDYLQQCKKCKAVSVIPPQRIDKKTSLNPDILAAGSRRSGSRYFGENEMINFKVKLYGYAKWSNFFNGYLMLTSVKPPHGNRRYFVIVVYLSGTVETNLLEDNQKINYYLRQAEAQMKELMEL